MNETIADPDVEVQTPTTQWDWLPVTRRSITFDVIVTLPAYAYNRVVHLHSDVPNFNQSIGMLNYELDSVNLKAKNGHVRVDVRVSSTSLALRFVDLFADSFIFP